MTQREEFEEKVGETREQAECEWPLREQREAPQPNLIELKGGYIKITYASTSFSGIPLLTYEDASGVRHFKGDEIRQLDTEIGRQVTVSTDRVHGTTLTLLVPIFKLNLNLNESSFTTWAITTTCCELVRNGDAERTLPVGALQTYRVDELRGTAKKVYF